MKRHTPTSQDAENYAIAALQYLAEDPEHLVRFMDICGLTPESLRAAAAESHFLLSVLEYLLSDEKLLINFAQANKIPPEYIAQATDRLRQSLERQ